MLRVAQTRTITPGRRLGSWGLGGTACSVWPRSRRSFYKVVDTSYTDTQGFSQCLCRKTVRLCAMCVTEQEEWLHVVQTLQDLGREEVWGTSPKGERIVRPSIEKVLSVCCIPKGFNIRDPRPAPCKQNLSSEALARPRGCLWLNRRIWKPCLRLPQQKPAISRWNASLTLQSHSWEEKNFFFWDSMEAGVFAKIVKLDRTQSKCWPRHTDSLRKGVFFDYTYFSSYTWLEQQVVFAAFACNGRRRCWHGRRRHEVLQTGGGLARIVSFFCQMGIFFDGLWCIQANLSSPRDAGHMMQRLHFGRSSINTGLWTEGSQEHSAVLLCQTVDGCLPPLRFEAMGSWSAECNQCSKRSSYTKTTQMQGNGVGWGSLLTCVSWRHFVGKSLPLGIISTIVCFDQRCSLRRHFLFGNLLWDMWTCTWQTHGHHLSSLVKGDHRCQRQEAVWQAMQMAFGALQVVWRCALHGRFFSKRCLEIWALEGGWRLWWLQCEKKRILWGIQESWEPPKIQWNHHHTKESLDKKKSGFQISKPITRWFKQSDRPLFGLVTFTTFEFGQNLPGSLPETNNSFWK